MILMKKYCLMLGAALMLSGSIFAQETTKACTKDKNKTAACCAKDNHHAKTEAKGSACCAKDAKKVASSDEKSKNEKSVKSEERTQKKVKS